MSKSTEKLKFIRLLRELFLEGKIGIELMEKLLINEDELLE